MSKKNKYWLERQAKQAEKFTDAKHRAVTKKYKKYYKQTLKGVERMMTQLYYDILDEEGKPSANELYKYNRLYKMREELTKALSLLGKNNIRELGKAYKNVYQYTVANTLSEVTQTLPNNMIDALMKEMWEARGKYWSTNVWCSDGLDILGRTNRNMNKLQKTLEKGLLDCVARGAKKDDLVKTLQSRFNVSYSEADRLVRTELTYIQNQGTLDSYKKAGITQYQYLASIDDRTSAVCADLNGQKFDVVTAMVGTNFPPTHPNCRCTTIPVLNDNPIKI